MTAHTWTTTADVPPAAWAAMTADMDALLGSWAQVGGAQVTGPDGTGPAQLDADTIAFTVTLPGAAPLAVTFARAAGDGSCTTQGHITDGLVVVALTRAARHWGALLSWTSEAGTAARAVAAVYGDALFGGADRAVAGLPAGSPGPGMGVPGIVAAAQGRVQAAHPTAPLGTVAFLAALLQELTAEHDGRVAAAALLAPPTPAPVPVAARGWFTAPA